jgi:hypothetical protein
MNQGNHGNSKFAKLRDEALGSAIWSGRDDCVVSPPNIEDTTHGLHDVKPEKGELARISKQVELMAAGNY